MSVPEQHAHRGVDRVIEQAAEWRRAGRSVALATVVSTWGSAPRRPGAQLVVEAEGSMAGSVSGGCVEGAVVAEAREVMADGGPRLLEFGVTNDEAWAVGLACGGTMEVFVQAVGGAGAGLSDNVVDRLVAARAADRPAVLVTALDDGESRLIEPGDGTADAMAETAMRALRFDQAGLHEIEGRRWLVNPFNPPQRMVIVGAVHIAQALAPLALQAGFGVTVIDPRRAFATRERFPAGTLLTDWPDEALAAHAPDARTAVITLTHDPKLDDPALAAALRSDAFYIGALGSRRTHGARVDRLREAGFTDVDLERIHGPVGFAIGARGPAEIAVSILAEVISVLRRGQ